jgi:protein-histidine pros-kinase
MNEVVGAQVLTVPVTEELKGSLQLVGILGIGLALVFGVVYLALVLSLDAMIIRPLGELSRAAEAASLSSDTRLRLPRVGAREVHVLAEAIERLRASLSRALARVAGAERKQDEAGA